MARVEVALDTLKTACALLANIADGPVNVPILKGAAGLAKEIITIAQVCSCSSFFVCDIELMLFTDRPE